MKFNTYEFLLAFLPLVIVGFGILRPLHRQAAVVWLVLASLFFYAWWEPAYLWLLIGSIVVNFALGLGQARMRQRRGHGSKGLLAVAATLNLVALGWFKYAGFLAGTLAWFSGAPIGFADILLPLAISFFTFQQIAYQVDCYHGLTEEHSFLDYCLFVTFFPQLVAGPIVHHGTVLPQVRDERCFRFSAEGTAVGLTLLILGLAKKVLIADTLAPSVARVFTAAAAGEPVGAAAAWGGTLAFTCQIYFDFSGYSDMAVGLGRLFGIRLPRNFDSPLRATNIIDFWNRWHITLSAFLRDYLFFPLCGKRPTNRRRHIALFLTMVLGGLWHGAAWTFVVWGAIHGAALWVNHAWRAWRGKQRPGLPVLVGWALTFTTFAISLVFFRAPDFATAGDLLTAMVGLGAEPARSPYPGPAWGHLAAAMLLAVTLPNIHRWMAAWQPTSDRPLPATWIRWQPRWYWWLPVAVLGLYTLTQLANVTEFLYYNF